MKTKSPRHLGMKRNKKADWSLGRTILDQSAFHKIPFHRKKQNV
jgi:hypothetical protein